MFRYAELVCRSAFSFHEGTSLPEDVIDQATTLGLAAVAITDRDAVYGLPRAHKHRTAVEGAPPLICGALLTVEGGPGLAVLVHNMVGWSNLCRLVSLARSGGALGEDPDTPTGGEDTPPHGQASFVNPGITLVNAGAAIYVAGESGSIKEGVQLADRSIESGAARDALEDFVKTTRRLSGTA